ncbi:MAG TPA: cytochrome c oxidase assembly protein [Alphaproteobacteria bacterium]|nr:cytochrome c oxidase assembly protein [Alphaproteobacteria bacterium]
MTSGGPHQAANRRVALAMSAVVVVMAGLAFAAVPLYRVFCQVTGYGGTTQRAEIIPGEIGKRVVTVRFNGDVAGHDLPWQFTTPKESQVDVHVGEDRLVFFHAKNVGQAPSVGVATFNVTPFKAGPYFKKVACFCFSEQMLNPGESIDMGVSFFVDPAIDKDPNLRDVTTITLSYTFFRAKDEQERLGRLSAAVPPSRPVPERVN